MTASPARAWLAALVSILVVAEASSHSHAEVLGRGAVRALVVSPHPDDATLGAAGLIQRVVRNGGAVQVVEMTSGDAFSKGVAAARPGAPPSAPSYRW